VITYSALVGGVTIVDVHVFLKPAQWNPRSWDQNVAGDRGRSRPFFCGTTKHEAMQMQGGQAQETRKNDGDYMYKNPLKLGFYIDLPWFTKHKIEGLQVKIAWVCHLYSFNSRWDMFGDRQWLVMRFIFETQLWQSYNVFVSKSAQFVVIPNNYWTLLSHFWAYGYLEYTVHILDPYSAKTYWRSTPRKTNVAGPVATSLRWHSVATASGARGECKSCNGCGHSKRASGRRNSRRGKIQQRFSDFDQWLVHILYIHTMCIHIYICIYICIHNHWLVNVPFLLAFWTSH